MQTVLLTGAAGFIGSHVALRLIARGDRIIGFDNLNDYYEVSIKEARLARLTPHAEFEFIKASVEDKAAVDQAFSRHKPTHVIHLAAQAGVRYSLENPYAYIDSNITGTLNILEACRHQGVEHLTYASSSSVYGGNERMPFSEAHSVDHPVSLYAATKKANELMAHTYSHLFGVPTTGLRFFTVYGPWGRPDMALFLFTRAILKGEPIRLFNNGQMTRDFTYIEDIVEGVIRVNDRTAAPDPQFDPLNPDPGISCAPYRVFNIGNSQPTPLMDYVSALEEALGIEAQKHFMPMQDGDIPATAADTSRLEAFTGFKPNTSVREGVRRFVEWYRGYYGL